MTQVKPYHYLAVCTDEIVDSPEIGFWYFGPHGFARLCTLRLRYIPRGY